MYVTTIYRATVADSFDLTRHCSACDRQIPASVSAATTGEATSPFGIGNSSGLATEIANAALLPTAQHMLDLAECPHCKKREKHAYGRAWRGAAVDGVLHVKSAIAMLFALVTVMMVIFVGLERHIVDVPALIVAVVLCAIWALVIRWAFRRSLRKRLDLADATVMWLVPGATGLPPPEVMAPPAPAADNGWPFA